MKELFFSLHHTHRIHTIQMNMPRQALYIKWLTTGVAIPFVIHGFLKHLDQEKHRKPRY